MASPKHDIYLAGQPLRVKAYQRSATDDLVARFGSAEQGQTNLDLLKIETQKGFRGGMFQKLFDDAEMVNYIRNAHYNPLDDNLYFTPEMERTTVSGTSNTLGVTAYAIAAGNVYMAFKAQAPSAGNRLCKYDISADSYSWITLPSAISTSSSPITSICVGESHLYIAGKSDTYSSGFKIHRMNLSTQNFASLGGDHTYRKLCKFNDKLYAMGLNSLWLVTSPAGGTAKFTKIRNVGVDEPDLENVHDMFVFNGALYITKTDGLYRYDGVGVNAVFDYQKAIGAKNFKFSAVFNGRVYYTLNNKLYQFDGTNVEMIQDFSDAYVIVNMTGTADRLWITATYNESASSLFDLEDTGNRIYALISYNGVGFTEYQSYEYKTKYPERGFSNLLTPVFIGASNQFLWVFPDLYYTASLEPRSDGIFVLKSTQEQDYDPSALPVGRRFEVYSSKIHCGYDSVLKVLNGISVNADGFYPEDATLQLYVRYNDENYEYDWVEVWNSQNRAGAGMGYTGDYLLHDESRWAEPFLVQGPLAFFNIEFKLVGTILSDVSDNVAPTVQSTSLRYTLQPRFRRKWLLTLPIYGKDNRHIDDMYLGDNSKETRSSNEIRRIIYDSYRDKKPVLFYDIDYSTLGRDETRDTWTLAGVHTFREGDFIAIKHAEGEWYNAEIGYGTQALPEEDKLLLYSLDGYTDYGRRSSIGGWYPDIITTGWLDPVSVVNVPSENSSTTWQNPNNILSEDGSVATGSGPESGYLVASYDFSSIPSNAVITGVELLCLGNWVDDGDVGHDLTTSAYGNVITDAWDAENTPKYITVTNDTDVADYAFSDVSTDPSLIESIRDGYFRTATTFKSVDGNSAEVDVVQVRVSYTVPFLEPGSEVRQSHAVYVTRIQNERVILDENMANETNGYSDYSSEIVVELTEI